MYNNFKQNTLFGAAMLAAVLVLVQSSAAGAPSHVMLADRPHPVYELKTAAAPEANKPLLISLVNKADGQPVSDGQVAVMRPVYLGIKASPSIQYVPVPLARDAYGNFVCPGEHHVPGERLTLRGTGPEGSSSVWLTLTVKS